MQKKENKEIEEKKDLEETKKSEKKEIEEKEEKASWIKMKPAELEKIVKELAEQGNNPAKIGVILRDKYGIPDVRLLGKRMTKILKDSNVKYITEKDIVTKKIEGLKVHSGKHKYDNSAKRSLAKQLWVLYDIKNSALKHRTRLSS